MAYKRKTEEEVRESYKKRGIKIAQNYLNPSPEMLAGFEKASASKRERAKNPTPKMLAAREKKDSPETRQRKRESAAKRWAKEEERERQSLATKKSYESGTRKPLPPFTEEHKENLKEAAAKREENPTQAMIEGRSKPFTEERKQKIGIALTKAWEQPSDAMIAARFQPRSEECRQKISKTQKESWKSPTAAMIDAARRSGEWSIAKWLSSDPADIEWQEKRRKQVSAHSQDLWENNPEEMKNGLDKARAAVWAELSPEERSSIISERAKSNWENPTQSMLDALAKARAKIYKPSRPQRRLFEMVQSLKVEGFLLEFRVNRYSLDIAHPELRLCVEVDEPYYHQGSTLIKDAIRDQYLQSLGWKVFRVGTSKWELLKGLDWVKAQLGIQSPTLFKEDPCRSSR